MVTLHSTTSRAYCPPSWHDPSVASPGGQAAAALAPRCLGRMRQCVDVVSRPYGGCTHPLIAWVLDVLEASTTQADSLGQVERQTRGVQSSITSPNDGLAVRRGLQVRPLARHDPKGGRLDPRCQAPHPRQNGCNHIRCTNTGDRCCPRERIPSAHRSRSRPWWNLRCGRVGAVRLAVSCGQRKPAGVSRHPLKRHLGIRRKT
jgi:hypothetical protein